MTDVAIDPVRASRDGHQYHEAWLARRALGLLMPRDGLCGIAVEGLSEDIEEGADQALIEIADATFYYGEAPSFEKAAKIDVAQFKYSIARASSEFRFADLKKTVKKFCTSETSLIEKYGEDQTWDKFRYSVITNRPISPALTEAVAAAAEGRTPAAGDATLQHNALRDELGLPTERLKKFCARLALNGSAGALDSVEHGNAAIIADWSASHDVVARARLGDLRALIRKKGGSAGQSNKLVVKVDILAALDLAEESDLLPTPQAFPEVGDVVERAQLTDFISKIDASGRWLVHAVGGIGKTVFVQSLYSRLQQADEVVIFDCFGGGAYRSPIDGRHRPERGLLHIVNELACRGLCDPILPGTNDPAEVIRRSILRFSQSIGVMRRTRPSARLIVIIDAADNAALEAANRSQPSFPKDLLEGLTHLPPIEGLVIVATARTERRELAVGTAQCNEYQLEAFTLAEAKSFISARRSEATSAQIEAIARRADGNPRVIANLIEPDRSLAGEAETTGKVELNALIEQRIERATKLADEKGAKSDSIAAFLCALSRLPPPVPITEIATAFGFQQSEIESLAADLSPLLERTRHGLIFRDEPTETLVSHKYGSQLNFLNDVVTRLHGSQATSVYAARALPGLLLAMGRVQDLHQLAFDIRFPPELDSDVAKRAIRLTRLKTALAAAAKTRDFDAAADLLVELSSIVLGDERGEDYLLENPDLVVALADSETLRRLFEVRTSWPGTRHARLAVAYITDGDTAEAHGHAVRTEEWLKWSREQEDDDAPMRRANHPEIDDYIAIPFYLLAKERFVDVGAYIGRWRGWYGYQMAKRLFDLCAVAQSLGKVKVLPAALDKLSRCQRPPHALIAAALASFPTLDSESSKRLLAHLATGLEKPEEHQDDFSHYREQDSFKAALLRCSMRAARLGMKVDAAAIHKAVAARRYDLYALHDPFNANYIGPWLLSVATRSAIENQPVTLLDCLPNELFSLLDGQEIPQTDDDLEKLLRERINAKPTDAELSKEQKRAQLSASEKQRASDHIRRRIRPLIELAQRLVGMLAATSQAEADQRIVQYFLSWAAVQESKETYDNRDQTRFLNSLYTACAFQVFTGLGLLNRTTAPQFAERLAKCEFLETSLKMELVRQLALQPDAHEQAGKMAVEAVKAIELEDEVKSRSGLFGRLARALFPADRSEAGALFKRGLSELDALGSGDYEFTNELLGFSASLRLPVNSTVALRLAKICELNNYDSHKFPWPLSGKAFSRAWGLRYVAQIARWDDRDKADLELTLPTALTFLIRDELLAPEDAIPLLGLVDVVEMWDWGWKDIFTSLIDVNAAAELFEATLHQYEANHPSGSYYHLSDIRAVLETSPVVFERLRPALDHLEDLAAHRRKADRYTSGGATPEEQLVLTNKSNDKIRLAAEAAAGVDPTSPTALEALVERLDEIDGAMDTKLHAFQKLRAQVPYGARTGHIEAIIATRNLELFAKNTLLQETKQAWMSESPSGLDVFKRAGVTLVKEHAQELVGSNWGFNWELNKLAELSGVSRNDLAINLVEAATSRDLSAAATTWLNLASLLSPNADPSIPKKALERLLDSGAARLADDVGDGIWRAELDSGDDPQKTVAGLLWYCLGSPHAAQRWRAAHVVRDFARLGRWKIIEALVALFENPDAGAFQDRNLPFFILHARLWLLLAVARIALDYPERIAAFMPLLEKIATDDTFPHVALREAARRALLAGLGSAADPASAALKARLAAIDQSKFPRPKNRALSTPGFQWDRPADAPRPDFDFEYDFSKYDLNGLGRLFGLPQWQIGDRCAAWIRKWDQKTESMYDFAGRRKRGESGDYKIGTQDNYHSRGTYLAWHALALVGGELLLERPISELSSYEDPWEEWLHRYSITRGDGLWLADGTGQYPFVALHDLMRDNDKAELPVSDKILLLSLAGIDGDLGIKDQLTVSGSWNSPDRVHVSITSALVPGSQAELVARSLAACPPFHMWLPNFRHYDDDGSSDSTDYAPAEPWISSQDAYTRLDEYDPLGTKAALERYRPGLNIKRRFRLASKDVWSARWSRPRNLLAFAAGAWGVHSGMGRAEQKEQGNSLNVDTKFLSLLLKKLDRSLVLLVKLQHYRDRNRFDEGGSGGDFTHSWLIAVVDRALKVTLYDVNATDLEAVAKLPEHSRYSFRERMRVLSGK